MYDIGSSPCTCEQEYKSEKDTLKAELAEAQDAAIEIANNQEIRIDVLGGQAKHYKIECERLREALQAIIELGSDVVTCEITEATTMSAIAKQALKGESDEL